MICDYLDMTDYYMRVRGCTYQMTSPQVCLSMIFFLPFHSVFTDWLLGRGQESNQDSYLMERKQKIRPLDIIHTYSLDRFFICHIRNCHDAPIWRKQVTETLAKKVKTKSTSKLIENRPIFIRHSCVPPFYNPPQKSIDHSTPELLRKKVFLGNKKVEAVGIW